MDVMGIVNGIIGPGDRMTSRNTRSEEPVSPDVALSAVADEHRRAILRSLDGAAPDAMTVEALADAVIEHVTDGNESRDRAERRRDVRIALHHVHLPKLAESRMVDHERGADRVRLADGDLGRELLTVVDSCEVLE